MVEYTTIQKKQKKSKQIHIQVETYNSIEGKVLIHAHSYDWKVTPENVSSIKKYIRKIINFEKDQKRIIVSFKNGQQVIEKGLF
jgi:superfamily I DNA and RNA helicase